MAVLHPQNVLCTIHRVDGETTIRQETESFNNWKLSRAEDQKRKQL
jgi:hypothetical protein